VEVGRKGVTIPLVVLLFTNLLIFLCALPRIVPLGMIFQADWMDPFFLVLIITVVHLEFIEWGVLPLGSTRWTLAMSKRLFLLFLFKHGPFIVINDARCWCFLV
jgi:hypothetical protein